MIPFWSPKSKFHFSAASFLCRPEIFCHYRDFLTMIFVFGSSRSICSTLSLVTGRLRCMRYWTLKVPKTGCWRPRVRSPPRSNIFALFEKVQEWLKSYSGVILLMFHGFPGQYEPFYHSEADACVFDSNGSIWVRRDVFCSENCTVMTLAGEKLFFKHSESDQTGPVVSNELNI